MSSGARWYYICDACGGLVNITAAPIPSDESWACDDCGCESAWEFTNETHALHHSAHIRGLVRDGLTHRLEL